MFFPQYGYILFLKYEQISCFKRICLHRYQGRLKCFIFARYILFEDFRICSGNLGPKPSTQLTNFPLQRDASQADNLFKSEVKSENGSDYDTQSRRKGRTMQAMLYSLRTILPTFSGEVRVVMNYLIWMIRNK